MADMDGVVVGEVIIAFRRNKRTGQRFRQCIRMPTTPGIHILFSSIKQFE